MLTHKEAKTLFDRCKNKKLGYQITHDTRIHMRGRSYAIQLYDTSIVIIRQDGTYRIDSGGFRTTKTKRRMNSVLPCIIEQHNGLWSIGDSFFQDRMLIGHNGTVIGKSIPIDNVIKIKKRVDKYCKNFIQLLTTMYCDIDIGSIDLYTKHHLPRHNSKTHLKDFWSIIVHEVDTTQIISGLMTKRYLLQWIYLSLLSIHWHHEDKEWQWSYRRTACLKGDIDIIRYDLLRFILPRKVVITQMILDGELG